MSERNDVTPGTPLLPCPFCESTRVEWRGVYVLCWDCDARGPRRVLAGESQLAWNRRAPSPETGIAAVPTLRERLLQVLYRFGGTRHGKVTMTEACADALVAAVAAGPAPEPVKPHPSHVDETVCAICGERRKYHFGAVDRDVCPGTDGTTFTPEELGRALRDPDTGELIGYAPTGQELVARYGFKPVASSGAAAVPGTAAVPTEPCCKDATSIDNVAGQPRYWVCRVHPGVRWAAAEQTAAGPAPEPVKPPAMRRGHYFAGDGKCVDCGTDTSLAYESGCIPEGTGRAPAAPPGPPKGKMCTHGRPFRWYEPHETIACQHCCLELGDQCPTCRGEGRVPAATPGTAPPSEPKP